MNKTNKCYESEDYYSCDVYEPYLNGMCYIFKRNIIEGVVIEHSNTWLIPMEDAHISYLVSNLRHEITDSPYFYYCTHYLKCNNSYTSDIERNLFIRRKLWPFLKADFVHDGEN
ncbi:hypothetical protein RF11_12556 [Thelohanellus kitauei]|uniref:Uncharacterized protein n=1 Tax=Thelohanellus kitauei TaxID=669202 RepID=A0A0C2JF46_THEKT|nr:hypothetical protein RF11_12556 [Thelohanellus kitauei]